MGEQKTNQDYGNSILLLQNDLCDAESIGGTLRVFSESNLALEDHSVRNLPNLGIRPYFVRAFVMRE
jgi:hypothetical protein